MQAGALITVQRSAMRRRNVVTGPLLSKSTRKIGDCCIGEFLSDALTATIQTFREPANGKLDIARILQMAVPRPDRARLTRRISDFRRHPQLYRTPDLSGWAEPGHHNKPGRARSGTTINHAHRFDTPEAGTYTSKSSPPAKRAFIPEPGPASHSPRP